MKLVPVTKEKHVASIRAKQIKNSRSDKIDRWYASILWRKEFIETHNLKCVKIFLDSEDQLSKFLFIKQAREGINSLKILHHNRGYILHDAQTILNILKGAEEALLYFERKITDNNEPLFVFRIERKRFDNEQK